MKTTLAGLLGIAFLLGVFLFYESGEPALRTGGEIILEIPTGASLGEIAELLKSQNLIQSERIFKVYALLVGYAHKLKAGRYILKSGLSIPELARALAAGPQDISVVIVPGMTLKEIDDRLSSLNIIKPGTLSNIKSSAFGDRYPWLTLLQKSGSTLSGSNELTKTQVKSTIQSNEQNKLEGFLFPDTYYFSYQTAPDVIVKKFLDNFEEKVLFKLPEGEDLSKIITLASLLEKEIPDENESRIVAGILEKRLKAGMPLQVDATLVYAKCAGRFIGCSTLGESDFGIDSPYNTYRYPGLPVGPISNPGLAAIQAAANPISSEYWYYLSDPETKKTIFAKTLDEHNQNRAKYLLSQ